MLVRRGFWLEKIKGYRHRCEGWFLFGFIPVFIRKINVDL